LVNERIILNYTSNMQLSPQQQLSLKYFSIIIIILAIVFFSRQLYSEEAGRALISAATSKAAAYIAKGSNWAMSSIYPKISGEVQKRGDIIKTEVSKEKQKVSEDIGKKIGNYFSGVANSILHPGENNNCQVQPSQTQTN
jgi:hypothetical protein